MLGKHPTLKRTLHRSGIVMIVVSITLIIAIVTGLISQAGIVLEDVHILPGESLIHTFARLSVLGCMLCALGSLE